MFDVAIVGYGPVGATLANFLGQDGWRVAVLEATSEIFPIPRAVHIDDEAQRIFQAAGVLDLLTPSFGGYPPDRQYINAKGEIFFETHLNTSKPVGFQGNMYFHQPTLEAGLRDGVARFSHVEVFLNTCAIGLTQDGDSVTVQTQNAETGLTMTVQARYVVGCDGARSFVRKALGIPLRDLYFEQPWLVTDFYLKPGLTREDVGFPYAHQQICNPKQPISFIPSGTKNHYRFEFMLPSGVSKAAAEQTVYVHKMLSQVVDIDKIDIVRGAVYTFHSLIAERWRDKRIYLAGDAAHQMPPFAGQGMCSGLRDIHNLSWKLRLVLDNCVDEALLDSYEMERKPHVTRMTRGAMFLGNLVQTQNPVRGWFRDLLFRTVFKLPALFGWIARYALRPPALKTKLSGGTSPAAVGTYFIQPEVADEFGNSLLLDEVLGSNIAVLGLNHDPAPYFATLAHQIPLCCVEIACGEIALGGIAHVEIAAPDSPKDRARIKDYTGKLAAWFDHYKADFVIIRPDRYVLGAYTTENIATAVHELSAQLKLQR